MRCTLTILLLLMVCSACKSPGAPCETTADCISTEICVEDGCHPVCDEVTPCEDGLSCQHGVCLPGLAPVDAGATDAASPDSGAGADGSAADAGGFDTSADDAATPDHALPDTALPDVAVPDTALPDSAQADTGQPDAALPDSAQPDAVQPDTALPDTGQPDAALPDTSLPDVSQPDSSIPDAAQPDTADAGPERLTDDLILLYTFREGSGATVQDVSGVGGPVDLTIEDLAQVDWQVDGLHVDASSPTLIHSGSAPTKLYNACMSNDALTVEAWITADALVFTGPARVVTVSATPMLRNFTMGQGGTGGQGRWNLRLRTDDVGTTTNGMPQMETPDDSTSTSLTHLVFTHSAASGLVHGYLDGVEQVLCDQDGPDCGSDFVSPGAYSNWDTSHELGLGWELSEEGQPRAWSGTYHLVAVYCRQLSAVEVLQNYQAGPP